MWANLYLVSLPSQESHLLPLLAYGDLSAKVLRRPSPRKGPGLSTAAGEEQAGWPRQVKE